VRVACPKPVIRRSVHDVANVLHRRFQHSRVANIALYDREIETIKIRPVARWTDEGANRMAARKKRACDGRADESRRTGDQHSVAFVHAAGDLDRECTANPGSAGVACAKAASYLAAGEARRDGLRRSERGEVTATKAGGHCLDRSGQANAEAAGRQERRELMARRCEATSLDDGPTAATAAFNAEPVH